MERLSAEELLALVRRVFEPQEHEKALAIIVDLPDKEVGDKPQWRARRAMALEWAGALASVKDELGLNVHLYLYRNAHRNNADLPPIAWAHRFGKLPESADLLAPETAESFESVLSSHDILIAPTQFSATAPLKNAAPKFGFRATTMPGFSVAMIPALRLDYTAINTRCMQLKGLLDPCCQARMVFEAEGEQHKLTLDLRHRPAHASGGFFPQRGTAGNLPSGETYIVPYEGEVEGEPTVSAGTLPVQFGDEVVVYRIVDNRAVEVLTSGAESRREANLLAGEPAYGNMAELGLGVLGDYGLKPTGEILLDEKLGLHIAFGRSDHFGGQVAPSDFTSPDAVVHIDRVYISEMQPRITVISADLEMEDGNVLALMRNGEYVISWDA